MTASSLARLLAVALAVAALPLWAQEGEDSHGAPASPDAPAITVSAVSARPLRERVVASGLVAAVEEVQVQPLVEGQPIDALLADVGDRVEEGQVLARLSTSSLELQLSQLAANRAAVEAQVAQAEASLAQAQANAAEAERQATRNAELAEAGTIPRAQAEQTTASAEAARAAVRVAEQGIAAARAQGELVEAQIDNAELQLSRTEVKAPVAGLVTARNAQVGAIASAAGAAMFTVVRDGAMELRAEMSEQDLLRVRPGQEVTMSAAAGTEPISGRVRLVEPAIDPQTRLGTARISIEDAAPVVDGMFLSAEILVAQDDGLAVPSTALASGEDGAAVMRVEDGVARLTPVVPGIRDGRFVGVTEGLAEGDLVVTKAAAFVRDGDRINPVPEGEAAEAAAPVPQAASQTGSQTASQTAPGAATGDAAPAPASEQDP